MRANAFLAWFVPLFALYVAFHAVRFYRKARREAEEREIMAARRKRAEAAKATRQSECEAAKAAKRAEAARQTKRKPGRPRKEPASGATPSALPAAIPPVPVFERPASVSPARQTVKGNNAFAGQGVAFTGTLPGMTRREAMQAVQDNGGRAFETMPAGTTLLVVGDNPGMNKLDKADRWIAQVRKITPAQFNAMLKQPLTLTPDEFAAFVAK